MFVALAAAVLYAAPLIAQPVPEPLGSPIVQSPAPSTTNVTVNVTPPPPDPQATQGMMDYLVSNTEYNHASVPVTWATGLLAGPNIWTATPWDLIDLDTPHRLRMIAHGVALSLFLLGIIWTGCQLAFGSISGTTSYQQLLPILVAGFLIAMYSDEIARRSVDLCNWLNQQFGDPSLRDFSTDALTLPKQPELPSNVPGIVAVPAAFFSGVFTTLLYAVVLLILEFKMIVRAAVLIVTTTVMPVSGAMWAFQITRGWGVTIFRLFFGFLFGQPLVVICLVIAGSLFTYFNGVDGPTQVLLKVAVLFLALKMVTLFTGGALGGSGLFGLAGLMLLLRRSMGALRNRGNSGAQQTGQSSQPAATSGTTQSGMANGTGAGNAATGRPWRPAFGTP